MASLRAVTLTGPPAVVEILVTGQVGVELAQAL